MAIGYYQQFQRAYDFYNERLFDGELEDCLIVFQRKSRTFGYISYDRHSIVGNTQYLHELALNPDYFAYRTIIETLSTLVHEMTHLKQHIDGTETRKTYHNKEFSSLMFERGLQTSSTGDENGKPVGQNMSHYILPDGKFLEVTLEFLRESNFKTFYDRFTPKYIEPSVFYKRSLAFITRMQGKIELEDVIPPYLIKYFNENPELLQGGEGEVAEPVIGVLTDPDDEITAVAPVVDQPVDDAPTEPVEAGVDEDDDEVELTASAGLVEPQGQNTDDLEAGTGEDDDDEGQLIEVAPVIKVDLTASEIKTLKPAEVALLQPAQIAKALKSPDKLLAPIEEMMRKREQEIYSATISTPVKPASSKHKFSCGCGNNLWGKSTLNVICGDCDETFQLA